MRTIKAHLQRLLGSSIIRIFKIVDKFEVKEKQKNRYGVFISIVFFLVLFVISCDYFKITFSAAKTKDFWVDEDFGLKVSVRNFSFSELLFKGAQGEGSTAPLDYILLKVIDNARQPLRSLGLPFNIYYRLNSILFSYLSGILVIFTIYSGIKKNVKNYFVFSLQLLFLICALSSYFFWYFNLKFSIEARPYCLWNSLWFSALMLFLYYKESNPVIIIILTLLAATATASIFQLFCFATGFFIVKRLSGERFKVVAKDMAKIFFLPVAVSLYYISAQKNTFSFANLDLHTKQFFAFWLAKEMIPTLSILGILITFLFKQLRGNAIVFLTMFMLYIISPLINFIVLRKGFFFSSRQYIFYDLIYPFFFTNIALSIATYLKAVRKYFFDFRRL